MLDIYPNPVMENATVSFELTSSSEVSFMVYDLNGRVIKTLEMGTLPSGPQTVQMNFSDLRTGTYILRSFIDNRKVTAKFIVY
jgi:hypothetical protein